MREVVGVDGWRDGQSWGMRRVDVQDRTHGLEEAVVLAFPVYVEVLIEYHLLRLDLLFAEKVHERHECMRLQQYADPPCGRCTCP